MINSKTIWFGFLLLVLGTLQTHLPELQELFDPTTYGLLTSVIGILVIILRYLTKTPLITTKPKELE